jgi:hypothetical protein
MRELQLPSVGKESSMTEYRLDHSDVPQPTLLDEEIATDSWPLPAPNPWTPKRDESMLGRAARMMDATWGFMNWGKW